MKEYLGIVDYQKSILSVIIVTIVAIVMDHFIQSVDRQQEEFFFSSFISPTYFLLLLLILF